MTEAERESKQPVHDLATEAASGLEVAPDLPPEPGVEKASLPVTTAESCAELVPVHGNGHRKDKGRLHAVHHGVLARHPMEALRHLGEDVKRLRGLERRFRAELRPDGTIADLVFDRFWSSYLRCLLAARAKATAFLPVEVDARKPARLPKLLQADLPTLVIDEDQQAQSLRQSLAPDVLRQLLLVQRYDRHFSREMYTALALLLVLRASGESGLERSITGMLGVPKEG